MIQYPSPSAWMRSNSALVRSSVLKLLLGGIPWVPALRIRRAMRSLPWLKDGASNAG
jgi:hypothetical protein